MSRKGADFDQTYVTLGVRHRLGGGGDQHKCGKEEVAHRQSNPRGGTYTACAQRPPVQGRVPFPFAGILCLAHDLDAEGRRGRTE